MRLYKFIFPIIILAICCNCGITHQRNFNGYRFNPGKGSVIQNNQKEYKDIVAEPNEKRLNKITENPQNNIVYSSPMIEEPEITAAINNKTSDYLPLHLENTKLESNNHHTQKIENTPNLEKELQDPVEETQSSQYDALAIIGFCMSTLATLAFISIFLPIFIPDFISGIAIWLFILGFIFGLSHFFRKRGKSKRGKIFAYFAIFLAVAFALTILTWGILFLLGRT